MRQADADDMIAGANACVDDVQNKREPMFTRSPDAWHSHSSAFHEGYLAALKAFLEPER